MVEITGLGAVSDLDIVAGFNLFRALKKIGSDVADAAPMALPIASLIPGVGPAAMAATAALRVAKAAQGGSPPARVAMKMLGQDADKGDAQSQRWVTLMNQATPLLDGFNIQQLAKLSRMGVPQARMALWKLATAADDGNLRVQRAIETAAGSYRVDPEVTEAGSWLSELAPRKGYRPNSQVFTPRDAYYEGLRALRGEARPQQTSATRR